MLFQKNNLPSDSQPWGRQVEDRIDALESLVASNEINNIARDKQLASSFANLSGTINQLNNNSDSKSTVILYAGGDPARPANGSLEVATVTFTKPSWATIATVVMSGNLSGYGAAADPLDGTIGFSVQGNLLTDSYKYVYSNGLNIDYSTFSSTTLPVNVDMLSVSVVFPKNVNGAAAAFRIYMNASVFWYAT